MGGDAVLATERAHLKQARECLNAMRSSAAGIADWGTDELGSETLGRMRTERLTALCADPDAPPFFGRIDRDDPDSPSITGDPEPFHIGRRHLRDDHGEPVVIDWRAPIARAFYRATAADAMGVRLRRRFGFRAGDITSFEDEHLDRGEDLRGRSTLLTAEIERPRVGPMRDIVATIAPDQDELVRADLDTSLCIQGAPGTGKTAVGLHRAAYLLYTYPDRLRRAGVLVVGPNEAFLHYIAQVLPALGEVGVAQARVDDLVAHVPVTGSDDPAIAVLKGDARLADVLHKAVHSQVSRPTSDVVVVVGSKRYRIPERALRRYVDDARRSGIRWSSGRDRLRQRIAADVGRQREDAGGAPTDRETAQVARSEPVMAFVDAVWPALTAPGLLLRLYADAEFLARCARGILTDDEQRRLGWPTAPATLRRARWSAADAVLLDELAGRLDGVPAYAHVVVDEAQDLSAMQCRAIARRCPAGSLTVLGDLAQATTPWAPAAWPTTLRHLGQPGATLCPLTEGYRVPGSILDLANRLLPHIAAGLAPATSVRPGAGALSFARSTELAREVARLLRGEGSIGVIVADSHLARVAALLRPLGARALSMAYDPRVTVVPSGAAKGLEFDAAVVVDPAGIVAAEPDRLSGLRRLYIVLTRAVSTLLILHDGPLPAELAA
ncbi:MAG: HelD family protein [Mycobacteriales bacterium]